MVPRNSRLLWLFLSILLLALVGVHPVFALPFLVCLAVLWVRSVLVVMRVIPTDSFVIVSTDPVPVVLELLSERVRASQSTPSSGRSFCGRFWDSGFKLTRLTWYKSWVWSHHRRVF